MNHAFTAASPAKTIFAILEKHRRKFAGHFGFSTRDIQARDLLKLYPRWLRPYGHLYAYQAGLGV
jgi:hypothetical protein